MKLLAYNRNQTSKTDIIQNLFPDSGPSEGLASSLRHTVGVTPGDLIKLDRLAPRHVHHYYKGTIMGIVAPVLQLQKL